MCGVWNVVCLLYTLNMHIVAHIQTLFAHCYTYYCTPQYTLCSITLVIIAYYMYGLSFKSLFAYSCVSQRTCTYIPCTCLPTIAYYCTLMCTIAHDLSTVARYLCIIAYYLTLHAHPCISLSPSTCLCPLLHTIAHYCTLIHIGLHPFLAGCG